jgi:type III pantothenate kinase
MLLVIDIGNTNTVLGVYDGDVLRHHWRLATSRSRTSDEYGVLIRQLFATVPEGLPPVTGAIVACVVPPMLTTITGMVERFFGLQAMVVGPGIRTGMPIHYENPREVGADRIVNAVAAYERFHDACIVVDLGTATTFDAISADGRYMGGAIAPGVMISAEALFARASKLPRIELTPPDRVVGRNTVASMQSGLVHGYVGLIDGMIDRIVEEVGQPMRTIATGGLAGMFTGLSRRVETHDPDLTLVGLKILYERNLPAR